METVYREFSSARWNYSDGTRISISREQFERMIKQGAKAILVT